MSPDGHYLAAFRCAAGSRGAQHQLVIRDLLVGVERVVPPPGLRGFRDLRLAFEPDSRHLVFEVFVRERSDQLYRVAPNTGEASSGLLIEKPLAWFGALGTTGNDLGALGRNVLVLNLHEVSGSGTVHTRRFSYRKLFSLPASPRSVVSDTTGRHLLAVVGRDLYRWSVGDRSAVRIARGVSAAAWVKQPRLIAAETVPASVRPVRAHGGSRLVLAWRYPRTSSLRSLSRVPGVVTIERRRAGAWLPAANVVAVAASHPRPQSASNDRSGMDETFSLPTLASGSYRACIRVVIDDGEHLSGNARVCAPFTVTARD